MDESSRQDEGDSPHIHFRPEAKPQHQQQYRRDSEGGASVEDVDKGGVGGGTSPPNVSSATTAATTPSSTATASSMAEHGQHLSSPPRALLPTSTAGGKSDPGNPSSASGASAAAASSSDDIDTNASIAQTYSTAPSTADVPAPAHAHAADPSSSSSSSRGAYVHAGVPGPRHTRSSSSSPSANNLVSIKLLVSNNVAGSIIGRSGQTISDLQVQSSARIKLSQSGDFFPGTSDRVCLVQGEVRQVKLATGMVLQKVYDLQRNAAHQHVGAGRQQRQGDRSVVSQEPPPDNRSSEAAAQAQAPPTGVEYDGQQPLPPSSFVVSSSFVVRVLVPAPFCGMLIGRGGANIKSMAESSGVTSIRLSPKESEGGPVGAAAIVAATSERTVTVTGPDLSTTVGCLGLIVEGMAAHPETGRYTNMTTSYSRASTAVSHSHSAASVMQGPQGGFVLPSSAHVSGSSSLGPFVGAGPMDAASAAAAGGFLLSPPSSSSLGLSSQHHHQRRSDTSPLPMYGDATTSEAGQQAHPIAMQGSHHHHQPQQMIGAATSSTQAMGGSSSQQQQLRYTPFSGDDDGTNMMMQPPPPPPPSPQIIPASPAVPLPAIQQPGGQAGAYTQASLSQPSQQSIYVVAPQTPSSTMQSIYSQAPPPAAVRSIGRSASRRSSQESITGGSAAPLSSATDQLASMQLSGSMQASSSTGDDGRYGQSHPGMTPPQGQATAMQISVPDTLIGAILGRGGQTLNELQMSSNTRIKISQRGVFVPGTNHRVVTISGPTAESVSTAHYLIGQRLARTGGGAVSTGEFDQLHHTSLHPAPPRQDSQEYMSGAHQYQQEQRARRHQQRHHRQSSTEGAPGAPPDRSESRH